MEFKRSGQGARVGRAIMLVGYSMTVFINLLVAALNMFNLLMRKSFTETAIFSGFIGIGSAMLCIGGIQKICREVRKR